MRIAYLSYCLIPSRRADSIHVMSMCQAFAREGHEVSLYAQPGREAVGDDYQYFGVEPCFEIVKCAAPARVGPHARLAIFNAGVVWRVASRPRPTVLYGRSHYSLAAAAGLGIPMALEVHQPPEGGVTRRAIGWLLRRRRFLRLVCISEALREEYLRLYPALSPQRTLVLPDGANLPASRRSAGAWAAPGAAKGRLRAGYVGHLYQGKGMELLARLAVAAPEVDFHIFGGTDEDVARWGGRTAHVGNLFLHGFVPPGRVDACREAMDVLLAPYQNRVMVPGRRSRDISRWMSPLKIFEYMAARRPIVSSDLPVLREVLTQGVNALLVPPDDVDAWAGAIRTLEKDATLRTRLADQAYQDLAAKYTWQIRAKNIIEALCRRGGASRP